MIELKKIDLKKDDIGEPAHLLRFEVTHNVGTLPTSLSQTLLVTLDPLSQSVSASMNMTGIREESFDDARLKLAIWCERMAAALRHCDSQPGLIPAFTRKQFVLKNQPAWLRAEYRRIARRLKASQEDDWEPLLKALTKDHHPLSLIYGAYDSLRREAIAANYPD